MLAVSAFGAGKPDWVAANGKSAKFPDALYLTGYGLSTVTGANDAAAAQNTAGAFARKNLIEKVRVQIQSVATQHTEESGDTYASMYASATQSTSSLDLEGLETVTYFDPEEDVQYAFVYAERERIASLYAAKIAAIRREMDEKKKEGGSYERQAMATPALGAYTACLALSRQLEEAQAVKASVGGRHAAADMQSAAGENEAVLTEVRQSISRLVTRPLRTVDDAAWYLAFVLKRQMEQRADAGSPVVMAAPLYYQDTKMGSTFSRYFKQVLENKLIEVAHWNVVQQGASSQAPSADPARDMAQSSGATCVLSGSLWDQGSSVKYIVNVRGVADGRILASAEATAEMTTVTSLGKSVKPENYQQALIDRKVFAADEAAGGGLTLEAWTNRGIENVMFTEDDTMKISVRVNYPCYVRLIYHMADGKRVLLLDNYFMDQSKVNLAYTIPDEFVCSPPFGGETLQAFARTEKFDELSSERIDGYQFLTGDLQKIVVNTRGFKKAAPRSMQTEQRISITTMKE